MVFRLLHTSALRPSRSDFPSRSVVFAFGLVCFSPFSIPHSPLAYSSPRHDPQRTLWKGKICSFLHPLHQSPSGPWWGSPTGFPPPFPWVEGPLMPFPFPNPFLKGKPVPPFITSLSPCDPVRARSFFHATATFSMLPRFLSRREGPSLPSPSPSSGVSGLCRRFVCKHTPLLLLSSPPPSPLE